MVEIALQEGRITKKEKESIDSWFKDPPMWAKKLGIE